MIWGDLIVILEDIEYCSQVRFEMTYQQPSAVASHKVEAKKLLSE